MCVLDAIGDIFQGVIQNEAADDLKDRSRDIAQQQYDRVDGAIDTFQESNPWSSIGASDGVAAGRFEDLLGGDPTAALEATPGFKFGLKTGQDAINQNHAAAGSLYSGGAMKEIARYGNDYGAGVYNNTFSQLMSVLDRGSSSSAAVMSAEGGNAEGYANTMLDTYRRSNTDETNARTGIVGGIMSGIGDIASSGMRIPGMPA